MFTFAMACGGWMVPVLLGSAKNRIGVQPLMNAAIAYLPSPAELQEIPDRIAGIAGVALSQLTNVGPNLGQSYIIDSFMVVVFGGVGNLWGTLVAGMTLGVLDSLLTSNYAERFREPTIDVFLAETESVKLRFPLSPGGSCQAHYLSQNP